MTEAEKYYHSLLTFGMRPGLERIGMLLERLGNPQNSCKFIHVAGTNGKGTTCVMLAEILRAQGYKTGLYTSPYIVDFRERIRVNGEMISEEELSRITQTVKEAVCQLNSENIVITEFEAVTAAAFLYYKKCGCEFAVLETGLGGRFDATNVIKEPLVSVITSISLDHVKILGNTLGEIAFEKCGIIKEGRPAVTYGKQAPEALKVIKEQTLKKNSPLYDAGECEYKILSETINGTQIEYNGKNIYLPFPGEHQTENCLTVLKTVEVLKKQGIEISDEAVYNGIKNSKNPARCEIINENPLIILDGCHNESSAQALKNVIDRFLKGRKIKAVMGMMEDKDIDRVLSILLPYFSFVTAVTPSNPRAVKSEKLQEKIEERGVKSESFENPAKGVNFMLKDLKRDEVLIVCGSLYLCADVRHIFNTDSI